MAMEWGGLPFLRLKAGSHGKQELSWLPTQSFIVQKRCGSCPAGVSRSPGVGSEACLTTSMEGQRVAFASAANSGSYVLCFTPPRSRCGRPPRVGFCE
jgi:hypothetical protein